MPQADWVYSALMVLAIVTAAWLARRQQQPLALSGWQRAAVLFGAFCGSMIAAKLPYVWSDWEGLRSGRALFDNGKTILAGMVGGYFGVELAKWMAGVRLKTGDSFAVPVSVGIAIGRLSCFHAGCCFGNETSLPWGINFGDGLCRHPTQLYEFAFHLLAAGVLWQLKRQGRFRGQLIKLYFLSYFAYRFATEFIRPEPRLWLGLTGYQLAAIGFSLLFAALWWHDRPLFGERSLPSRDREGTENS